jgi:hypothetical protein
MANVPHNFFQPPKEVVHPTPDPHQDEVDALATANASPLSGFVGLALGIVALCAPFVWPGPLVEITCLFCGVAAVLVSAFAVRDARRLQRPAAVAVAGIVVGVLAVVAFVTVGGT